LTEKNYDVSKLVTAWGVVGKECSQLAQDEEGEVREWEGGGWW
jgi:hypothetical protein